MAAERNWIDLEDDDSLSDAIETARDAHGLVLVRKGGRNIGFLTAFDPEDASPDRTQEDEDLAHIRATEGSWVGHIDGDAFLKANRESRNISTRPHPEL